MDRLGDGFLFGCSTSAYQVEGGIENDWSRWERQGRLHDPRTRCGDAAGHWDRYEADFDRLQALGANAYRFSIEWARVEPEPGRFDPDAIDRYVRMVDSLRSRGVEPVLTFLHFTHPPWFHGLCPWHAPSTQAPGRFGAFVARMMAALEDRVRWFTILNEPMVWLLGSYVSGVIPPGHKSLPAFATALDALLRGYLEARNEIKAVQPQARCGIAKNVIRFAPEHPERPTDRWLSRAVQRWYNHSILDALATGRLEMGLTPALSVSRSLGAGDSMDFIGVNYYTRVYLRLDPLRWGEGPRFGSFFDGRTEHGVSDLGWEIHPQGLKSSLLEMRRYGLPILITENGIADGDDSRRGRFLVDHLRAMQSARAEGADVRGYLHWSLLDNFEWLDGFGPRFGLFRVDYETMERTPTESTILFADIARSGRLPPERPDAAVVPGRLRPVLP